MLISLPFLFVEAIGIQYNRSKKDAYILGAYKRASTLPLISENHKKQLVSSARQFQEENLNLIDWVPFSSAFHDRYDLPD